MPPAGESVSRPALTSLFGLLNRARLGFPRYFFQGTGGIGDDLLCTTVFHELRRRGARGIAIAAQHPSLFWNNPDVDAVVSHPRPRLNRWLREGLSFVCLGYANYDAATDRDEPPSEHILAKICRVAGLTGDVQLRPYLFLTDSELRRGRLAENQIVMQSSGRSAAHFMQNKEWSPERFQEVCHELRRDHTIIQIGASEDPLLEGAQDLRGKTSLRESAAILANSQAFVGLVGFLMHLARAVDCRSVIVYGGRERPSQTGYISNLNVVGDTPCSPCWQRNRCDFAHECMNMISSATVLTAVQAQLQRRGEPLEIEAATL
jgi:hypothetical protein